ncbi:metallophosphoesterase [Halosegnis longus]|uniref:metallophosphoesterase n=1 Tax=Halosegnis longus TaxID=2216012 RepID=UPI00096AC099|nr:metallophosphoesterase [Salella cibi]
MERTYRDRAVYLPAAGTLVLSDLHIGRDESSNLELRVGEHGDLTARFERLLARFSPEEVVVAGDFLHSFSTLPRGVMETVRELKTACREAGARLVVTPGNHDAMLDAVWDGPTHSEYRVGDWVVCHGHEEPTADAEGYIVGHDHPAIDIEGQRRPCYLAGAGVYGDSDLLMLPAFTRLAGGVEVNAMYARHFDSPLVETTAPLQPVVRDPDADETLTFPPLNEFRRLL